jgi:hypothetical protein
MKRGCPQTSHPCVFFEYTILFWLSGRKVGAAACHPIFLAFVGVASFAVPTVGTRPSPKIMGYVATFSFETLQISLKLSLNIQDVWI